MNQDRSDWQPGKPRPGDGPLPNNPTGELGQRLAIAATKANTAEGLPIWQLLEPYIYNHSLNGGGLQVHVPLGFCTDFASVPRWLHWLFNPADRRWRTAAVVHDYLYSRAANCPRFLADAVFRDAAEKAGCGYWQRLAIFYAVRLCGGKHYHSR